TLSPAPALSAAVKTLLVFARSRATRTMIIAGMLTAIVMAMRAGLDLYMLLYFWGFAHPQIVLLTIVSAAGALAGAVLAPRISIVIGKKRAAIAAYSLSLINAVAPIMLKLAGLMPPNGSPALLTSMSAVAAATGLLFVVTSVLMSSMLADVADEIAANSGERVEGALFSIDQFFSKAISGLGVLLSAWLLTVAASASQPAAVSAEQMMRLAAWYAPLQVIVTVGAIMALARYPLGEAEHTANVNRIANRARG
ncbi:MAG: MFS transporter, partial [Hyphomonadaceae bacterium]